jgi:hypothetical protein
MATEIKDYDAFLKSLADELERLKQAGNFSGIKELPEIIQKIRDMQAVKFIPRVAEGLSLEEEDLHKELSAFFEPYWTNFTNEKELLEDLKKESGDFFGMRIAYQLSHARGTWKHKVKANKSIDRDIKRYFQSRVFSDCYETLPVLLYPVLRIHWMNAGKDESKFPEGVFGQYKFLIELLKTSSFKAIEIDEEFRKLRNDISHASVLFEGMEIFVWNDEDIPQKRSLFRMFPQMETMMDLLVIYATDLDLRILAMAQAGKDDIFAPWMEYFEIYVTWFHKNLGRPKPQA